MSAPHFFLEDVAADELRIGGEDARHAVRALRIGAGETITVADGGGTVATCRVRAAVAGREPALVAAVLERRVLARRLPALIIYPALTKAGKLDLVVQKLTEIGADAIRPWRAARSIPRWDDAKAAGQAERLRSIAREAAMQSRRAFLPEISDLSPLEGLPVCTAVLHEEASLGLRSLLPGSPPEAVGLIVGPEGGLTPDEVEGLVAEGAMAASLGPTVLRTETATIVATTIVAATYGLLG